MTNKRTLNPLPYNRRETDPTQLGRAEVIPQGFEGENVPDDFSIPSANIEDVDKALFNFFDKSLNLQVSFRGKTRMVPIVFAGSERYSMTQSGRPIRDKSGAIITPIIAVHRTGIVQGTTPSLAFGTDTGTIVIKRKLAASDREYQKLINRFDIRNQQNVASSNNVQDILPPVSSAVVGSIGTRRRTGGTSLQSALDNPLGDNIYEIITIPTPNFMTIKYSVTFWTSYIYEMNQIIERFISGHDIGSSGAVYNVRIESDKGYWYVAFFDEDISMEDNFTDFTSQQKMIKATVNVSVPAYTMGSKNPGDPLPLRKFLSAPSIDFDVSKTDAIVENMLVQMPMLGPEDPAFIRRDVENVPIDGRVPDIGGNDSLASQEFIFNPFATSQAQANPRFSRVVYRTSKGERVGRTTDAFILQRITKP